MSKRISKRVREEAALICAVDASLAPNEAMIYLDLEKVLGVSREATLLACDALCATSGSTEEPEGERFWARADAAEAEALLRTGWTP